VFLPDLRDLDLQDLRAALADNDCVGVREDGGDGEASRALDVHEEGAGSGHEGLELVLAGLTKHLLVACRYRRVGHVCVRGRGGVEEVNCENLEYCQPKALIEVAFAQVEVAEGCGYPVASSEGLVCPLTVPSRKLLGALAGSNSPF
jgi:hypothetical protein